MKIITKILILFVIISFSCNSTEDKKSLEKEEHKMEHTGHHNMKLPDDERVSLEVTGQRAKHQLMNMRDHVEAVQEILAYLSQEDYDNASIVASKRLGLTKQMQMMCSSFGNEEFEDLGFGFHNSADKMSEVFKTKDMNKSLEALSVTMNYCVTCHAKFKQ